VRWRGLGLSVEDSHGGRVSREAYPVHEMCHAGHAGSRMGMVVMKVCRDGTVLVHLLPAHVPMGTES
jgi:hypothetical protein